jgi:hypothetical protein
MSGQLGKPRGTLGPWQWTSEMAQGGLRNNLGGNLLCSLMDLTQSDSYLQVGTDMEYRKVNLC